MLCVMVAAEMFILSQSVPPFYLFPCLSSPEFGYVWGPKLLFTNATTSVVTRTITTKSYNFDNSAPRARFCPGSLLLFVTHGGPLAVVVIFAEYLLIRWTKRPGLPQRTNKPHSVVFDDGLIHGDVALHLLGNRSYCCLSECLH